MSIKVENISKNYGDTAALSNVSVEFHENKIYGLLGRNGAGKSTLLNLMTGRIFPTNPSGNSSARITVDGESIIQNDNATGKMYLMSEKTYYPQSMKISQVFKWSKEFYPDFDMEYALSLSEKFKLNVKKNVKSLSTGYNSIFKAVVALSTNAPYILLDEPVLGLDANHRDMLYRLMIEKYAENPCTIIISTHLIEEVSSVIEDVVIIKEGEIIRNTTRDALLSEGYSISGNADAVDLYIRGKTVIGADSLGTYKTAYIVGKADKKSIPDELEVSSLDLQKLFIQLTN